MLVVQLHHVHVAVCSQGDNGGGGCAGDDERGVDLTVLQGLGAVAEGLVRGSDIVQGQVVCAQHVHGVKEHAGAGLAHGYGLACQIGYRLDRGVQGNDLHLLHIQSRHSGKAVHLAVLRKEVGTVIGIGHNVGLHEAQLRVAHIHGLDVGFGALAHDSGHSGAGTVADLTGQNAAEAVIGTLIAAGGKGQLCAGTAAAGTAAGIAAGGAVVTAGRRVVVAAAAGSQPQKHHQGQEQRKNLLFHHYISPCLDSK